MHRSCVCCDAVLEDDGAAGVEMCRACRQKLGVVAMGHARRPPVPCQRCNGMQFVRAIPREHSSAYDSGNKAAPMMVTHAIGRSRSLWDGLHTHEIAHTDPGYGRLEMYICRACGFVEWYAAEPAAIPIGPEFMTELVDYASTTPYR